MRCRQRTSGAGATGESQAKVNAVCMLQTDNVSLLSSMFAIIYPVIWIPALTALFWLERRALKDNLINFEVARTGVDDTAVDLPAHVEEKTYWQRTVQVFQEVDTIGLLLLGFGWSLLLLPFALYSGADGGFSNRSLIAMLAIGPACLIAYPVYEWKFAKYPSMPKRILFNRTFVTSVIINFFCPFTLQALRLDESLTRVARTRRHARRVPPAALSQVCLHLTTHLCRDSADLVPPSCASLLFLALKLHSSYVYIVTDIGVTKWNCASFPSPTKCSHPSHLLLSRLQQRAEHGSLRLRSRRWPALPHHAPLQGVADLRNLHPHYRLRVSLSSFYEAAADVLTRLNERQGLLVNKNGVHDFGRLVMSQLLGGIGSAFSSIGSQVSVQASVPHQDVALVAALLLLWSSIGASVGTFNLYESILWLMIDW